MNNKLKHTEAESNSFTLAEQVVILVTLEMSSVGSDTTDGSKGRVVSHHLQSCVEIMERRQDFDDERSARLKERSNGLEGLGIEVIVISNNHGKPRRTPKPKAYRVDH